MRVPTSSCLGFSIVGKLVEANDLAHHDAGRAPSLTPPPPPRLTPSALPWLRCSTIVVFFCLPANYSACIHAKVALLV